MEKLRAHVRGNWTITLSVFVGGGKFGKASPGREKGWEGGKDCFGTIGLFIHKNKSNAG